jgi:SnoaL-like protein
MEDENLARKLIYRYFDAMNLHDAEGVGAAFTTDGELVAGYNTVRGAREIGQFYATGPFTIVEDLTVVPGEPVSQWPRIALEAVVRMGGSDLTFPHFFWLRDEGIARLKVYIGHSPA